MPDLNAGTVPPVVSVDREPPSFDAYYQREALHAAYQRGYEAAREQAVALCGSRANALTDGVVVGDQGFDARITRASEALCLAAAIRSIQPERKDS